jgi:hypothetical protein
MSEIGSGIHQKISQAEISTKSKVVKTSIYDTSKPIAFGMAKEIFKEGLSDADIDNNSNKLLNWMTTNKIGEKTIGDMINTAKASPETKENVEELLTALGEVVYKGMLDGGNAKYEIVLAESSSFNIDNALPDRLKGLGEFIVKNVVDNSILLDKITRFDKKLKNWERMGEVLGDIKEREYNLYYNELYELLDSGGIPGSDEDQLIMVLAGVTERIKNLRQEKDVVVSKKEMKEDDVGDARPDKNVVKDIRAWEETRKMPENEVDQLMIIRSIMEEVLGNPRSLTWSSHNRLLNHFAEQTSFDSVKKEVNAFLHRKHQWSEIFAAGGLLGANKNLSIENATEKVHSGSDFLKDEMSKDDLSFYLKEGANGLPVAKMFNALSKIGYNHRRPNPKDGDSAKDFYDRLLKEIQEKVEGGTPDTDFLNYLEGRSIDINYIKDKKFVEKGIGFVNPNYGLEKYACINWWNDGDILRKSIVQEYLVYKEANELRNKDDLRARLESGNRKFKKNYNESDPGSRDDEYQFMARHAFLVAKEVLEAYNEDSIYNIAYAGHDDNAEAARFQSAIQDYQTYNPDQDEYKKLKTVGPLIFGQKVISTHTTFLRSIAGEDLKLRMGAYDGPLTAEMININLVDDAKSNLYFWNTALIGKKIVPLWNELMASSYDRENVVGRNAPKWWGSMYDAIDKMISYNRAGGTFVGEEDIIVNYMNKNGVGRKDAIDATLKIRQDEFRAIFARGVLDQIAGCSGGRMGDTGYKITDVELLHNVLIHQIEIPEASEDFKESNKTRKAPSFITNDYWFDKVVTIKHNISLGKMNIKADR